MKKIQWLFLIFSLLSCKYNSQPKDIISDLPKKLEVKDSSTQYKKVSKIKDLKTLYNDTNSINLTDKGSFWLLYFKPGKVCFDFNPSCGYSFPTSLIEDRIIFNWAVDMNCNFDRGLNHHFKNTSSPIVGKPFGEIRLLNDSSIYIKYYFKEWVQKINEEQKSTIDTLFPTTFKVVPI